MQDSKTLFYNNKINILNYSTEDTDNSIEHVYIDENGDMGYNGVYESSRYVEEYTVLDLNNELYVLWKK